jgi:hypothetical protein
MTDYKLIKSSNYERVKQIQNERLESKRAMQHDYDRGLKAWQIYMGFYGGQWPEAKLALITADKRYAYQFNIVRPKVDTMAGAMITDLPDPDWIPVEGQPTTGTEAIKDTYFIDKEVCNWRMNLIEHLKGMLIHDSWIEMCETTKYDPLGNIALIVQRPGSFIPSAYWKSNDDRDLEKGWKSRYFNAAKLKMKYEKSSAAIEVAIQRLKQHGREELKETAQAAQDRRMHAGKVGDEYEVIEEMWLEIVKTERLYGRKVDELITIPFPLNIKEPGEKFEQFVAMNQIDVDTVHPEPYKDIVCHKTAVVPDLDPSIILHDAQTRVQIRGLPMFHSTTRRWEGRNMGMVETISDLQTTFNERMSRATELISRADGGATIWNEELSKDPDKKKEIIDNANRPGYNIFAEIDNIKTPYVKVDPPQYPSALMSQIELLYSQLLPIISGVSDAWSAESKSQDSGILYERKVQMNKIGTLLMDEGVKQLMNNLGEAYLYQWQITYGDAEREITKRGGKERTVLNEQLGDGFVRNSVPHTPRVRVIVTENNSSPTKNSVLRQLAMEMLQNINPQVNPITFQNVVTMFFKSMETLSDEDREKYISDLKLENAAAKTQIVAQIGGNTAATSQAAVQDQQAQAALAQMEAGPPQQQGQPTEQITEPSEQINPVPPQEEQEEGIMSAENIEI